MILFFMILSSLASFMLSRIISKKMASKYNLGNSIHIAILSTMLNLIIQYKFLKRITLTPINNSEIYFNLMIILCFLLGIVISSCLTVSFIIDLLYFELPNELNLIIGLSLIPFSIFIYSGKSLLTGLSIFIIYFLFAIFTDGFGMGDAKLALALGFGVEFSLLFKFMFLSFLFASIFSIIKIVVYKNKLKSEIAFGPFIVLSFLLIL